MSASFVPTTLIPAFIALAAEYNISALDLAKKAGIEAASLTDDDSVISIEQFDIILTSLRTATKDPAFALNLGQHLKFDRLQDLGALIATANTPGEALKQFVRFKHLALPYGDILINENGDTAQIHLTFDALSLPNTNFDYSDLYFSGMASFAEALLGQKAKIHRVCFRHDKPSYSNRYTEIFSAPIYFNQPKDILTFDSDTLHKSLPSAYPDYHQNIEKKVAQQMAKLSNDETLSIKVKRFIIEGIGHLEVSIETTASHLCMTPRTLQRKLKKENLSYATIRDDVKFNLAKEKLVHSEENINSIATQLGFTDPANFFPAFKRWSGISPGEFRKRNKT